MHDIFSSLTERRILEAIARGDSLNLPGAGKPLKIQGLFFLPQKLRAAYIVLKNSGYLEPIPEPKDRAPLPEALQEIKAEITISKQELSENLLKYQVMMDCQLRR